MSGEMFCVSIHYGVNSRGYIRYNPIEKAAEVSLPEKAWKEKVEAYLLTEHCIEDATGLDTYRSVCIYPLESLENLKLALTRMWSQIDVQVDWTRPPEL